MTLVVAHRGASHELPENTLPAFERAIELGADFVELDVHAGAEGALVVCHDPPEPGRAYPPLDEVLDLTRGRIGAMVELKAPYRYRRHDVVARVTGLLGDEDVLVSFEAAALRDAHRLRPSLRVLQHVGYGVSIRAAAGYAWGAGFDDARLTDRGLGRARALGLATAVYTVNDPARMRELVGLGVDAVITDRPDLLRAIVP